MAKTFSDAPHYVGQISNEYLLGIQTGNTPSADGGLEQMMYVKASELRAFMREGMASVYNYRGEFSALPTDLAVGDTFYAASSFSEGGNMYLAGHLYAYNGTSWDDITNIFTQYAKQGDLEALTDDVEAIDDRLTEAEAKIAAFSGGIVFKGETTSANLPSPSSSNKGWMYFVTDLGKYQVSDGTQWVDFGTYPIEAYALRSSFPATGVGQKLYIAMDEKKIYWWDGSTYVSDTAKMAEIDGYYQEMGVGTAEQLVSTQTIEDNKAYLFRTSGGSVDIGNREDDEIVGGTLGVNQLTNFANRGFSMTARTGSCNFGGTKVYVGHKIFISFKLSNCVNEGDFAYNRFLMNFMGTPQEEKCVDIKVADGTYNIMVSPTTTNITGLWIFLSNGSYQTTECYVSDLNLFDLTAMFGAEIADYIYALEQANAGAGVAWFRRYFPKPYYVYNAGGLASVKPSSHDMRGFNAWDEEWELGYYSSITGAKINSNDRVCSKNFIPILPNTTYYFKGTFATAVCYYDANKNFISSAYPDNETRTTPSNAYFMMFALGTGYGTTYKNDICINLSWSGTRNGEYEPFELHSYLLDDSTEYRGIPKLDAEGNLYFEGDIYKSSGDVTRRFGVMVLNGTEAWGLAGSGTGLRAFIDKPSYVKFPSQGVCDRFIQGDTQEEQGTFDIKEVYIRFNIYGIATDEASFKTWLSTHPTTLVYEKTAPTTETVNPFTNPQIVNDWGTEEYVDERDMPIPVGHNTKYMANLRDKLQHLPNLADGDGEYIVKQTGTQMELVETDNLKKDGYYPTLAVGTADNLAGKGTVGADFTFRTSGGSADIGSGSARLDKILGNTLMLNQVCSNGNFAENTGWIGNRVSVSISNNKLTATALSTVSGSASIYQQYRPYVSGHVYLACATCTPSVSTRIKIRALGSYFATGELLANQRETIIGITTPNGNDSIIYVYVNDSETMSEGDTCIIENVMLIDLTQMFGAGNEPTVDEFKALFPLDYYDYTEGFPLNFKGTGLKTVGFNQWDIASSYYSRDVSYEGGKLKNLVTDTNSALQLRIQKYKKDGTYASYPFYLDSSLGRYVCSFRSDDAIYFSLKHNGQVRDIVFATKDSDIMPNTQYFCSVTIDSANPTVVGGVVLHDVNLNFSWSGIRDGEFESYWDSTLPLPITTLKGKASGSDESVVIFPDGMKGIYVYNNQTGIYTRVNDELGAKKAIKRVKKVTITADMLTIFSTSSGTSVKYARSDALSIFNGIKPYTASTQGRHWSTLNGYTNTSYDAYWIGTKMCTVDADNRVNIGNNNFASLDDAKALCPFDIYFELTPVEYDLDEELNLNYRVDDFGTEQLLPENTSVPVTAPIIAQIAYAMNAADKLRHLPDLANADGKYAVQQTGTQMSLVAMPTDIPWTAMSHNDIPNRAGGNIYYRVISGIAFVEIKAVAFTDQTNGMVEHPITLPIHGTGYKIAMASVTGGELNGEIFSDNPSNGIITLRTMKTTPLNAMLVFPVI